MTYCKVIALCLLGLGNLQAQTYSYSPFPKQIGVWHFTEYNDYWNIVGGQNHQYVLDTATGLMTNGYIGYYEDGKKIFLPSASDTVLIYDFSLTIGDTIVANAPFGTDTFYVVSDDSLGYYGRRQITLMMNAPYYNPSQWVEGIGNVSGVGGMWSAYSAMSISGGLGFWCMFGDSVSIPCNSGLALEPEQSSLNVPMIYPNPVSGVFIIHNATNRFNELILQDALGRIVLQRSLPDKPEISVDVHELAPGLYFVTLLGSNAIHVEKIEKQ
jgi:hypothetical protein